MAASQKSKFCGYKFRRQYSLGCYVLDFYCPAKKLAIELDGGGHNYRLGQMRDKSRSNVLADHGVIVLRFWNHQVRYERDSVSKAIWFALEKRLLSQPSPQSSSLPKGQADFVRRRCNKRCETNKCEKTAQAVSSVANKSQNPSSDHGSFRHSIFIDVSHYPRLCVVHPVLDFND